MPISAPEVPVPVPISAPAIRGMVTRLAGGKGGEGWILLTFANMNKVRQQSGDLVGLLELV